MGKPPDPALYATGCRGKRRYPSKRQATGAMRVLATDSGGGPDTDSLNVYSCKACGQWHIGHSRRRRRE